MRPETMPENDVVDLLIRQHEEIRKLFDEVEHAEGEARVDAFERLRRYLAVHETAEELIVHPDARRVAGDGGDAIVDARLSEEHLAKEILEELEKARPNAPGFLTRIGELKRAVLQHAEREEREEFPLLRAAHGENVRATMGVAVKAVEALAPTRAHAGVESAKANLLVGPYAAMLDRARDVLGKALS